MSSEKHYTNLPSSILNKVYDEYASVDDNNQKLPNGYQRRNTGYPKFKTYYINHNNRTTSWDNPNFIDNYKNVTLEIFSNSENQTDPDPYKLPDGWIIKLTEYGKMKYYINEEKRLVSWIAPTQ